MVFSAFPEADTIRNIVRDIDRDTRRRIEQTLPFKIHFQELGEHKLHVAFRGNRPVGLMYVRTEQMEWGIAEIGWALSLECRVLGFAFANSRSDDTRELPRSAFAKTLIGCDYAALHALHESPAPAGEADTRNAGPARTVLRSAMKATLVVDLVWVDQVSKLADLAMLYDELPFATPGRRHVIRPEPRLGTEQHLLALHVIEARGEAGFPLGRVARTRITLGGSGTGGAEREIELRWVIDPAGRILRVTPAASWPDEQLRLMCSALRGRPLVDPALPGNPLAAVAREISAELTQLAGRRPGR
ncbi:MAG: hypothetical protein KDE27_09035 [Planctomycetes bacterium]|nr:hypothetical protein [Planctomycetota bacterium]